MKSNSTSEVKAPWVYGLQNTPDGLFFAGHRFSDFLKKGAPPSPYYLLSLNVAISRARAYQKVLSRYLPQKLSFHFAMKSNNNPNLMQALANEGFGADVVSGGELAKALSSGFNAKHIVFSGVAKSKTEIQKALMAGVGQINVEGLEELKRVTFLASQMGQRARVAIRVNPEVKAQTHPYIATGFRENKFGVDRLDLPALIDWILGHQKNLEFQGLSLHIGSQLLDFSALAEAIEITLRTEEQIKSRGLVTQSLDLGGGVGVSYQGEENKDFEILEQYAQTLRSVLFDYPGQIRFEPGRFWIARAGVLVSQVEYVKRTPHKNFLIINAGMNALLRPMLYEAYHRIEIEPRRSGKSELFDVVGPVCESTDTLGTSREFHDPQEGDFVCIADVGAYGKVLSSNYNLIGEVPELIFEVLI